MPDLKPSDFDDPEQAHVAMNLKDTLKELARRIDELQGVCERIIEDATGPEYYGWDAYNLPWNRKKRKEKP